MKKVTKQTKEEAVLFMNVCFCLHYLVGETALKMHKILCPQPIINHHLLFSCVVRRGCVFANGHRETP